MRLMLLAAKNIGVSAVLVVVSLLIGYVVSFAVTAATTPHYDHISDGDRSRARAAGRADALPFFAWAGLIIAQSSFLAAHLEPRRKPGERLPGAAS